MENLNKYFDHTMLKPEATSKDILKLCDEAKKYSFYSVCVNGCFVPLATKLLEGTDVKVAAVIGFPLGAMSTAAKAQETRICVEQGASEIDMVMNVGALKEGSYDYVRDDILRVVKTAEKGGAIVKVILETCLLIDEEIIKACSLAVEAGAAFVKTSTGFSKGGATEHHVALMKKCVSGKALVKASGGIRDYDTCIKMIEAGADRIGASASAEILEQAAAANA